MTFGFNTELGRKFGFRTDIIRGEDGSLALAMKPYGKLVFIHAGKARVMTGYGTLNNVRKPNFLPSSVLNPNVIPRTQSSGRCID